jgi:hypothetical protein
MADQSRSDGKASTREVWVRRCRSCGRDDLSAAFGQVSMVAGAWRCPACRTDRYRAVKLPMPDSGSADACPHTGAA